MRCRLPGPHETCTGRLAGELSFGPSTLQNAAASRGAWIPVVPPFFEAAGLTRQSALRS